MINSLMRYEEILYSPASTLWVKKRFIFEKRIKYALLGGILFALVMGLVFKWIATVFIIAALAVTYLFFSRYVESAFVSKPIVSIKKGKKEDPEDDFFPLALKDVSGKEFILEGFTQDDYKSARMVLRAFSEARVEYSKGSFKTNTKVPVLVDYKDKDRLGRIRLDDRGAFLSFWLSVKARNTGIVIAVLFAILGGALSGFAFYEAETVEDATIISQNIAVVFSVILGVILLATLYVGGRKYRFGKVVAFKVLDIDLQTKSSLIAVENNKGEWCQIQVDNVTLPDILSNET